MAEKTGSTQVDLGDDLLQTRTVQRPAPSDGAPARAEVKADSVVESSDELLLNAKILMGEGLLEDAKKTLRRVLRVSPGNLTARDRLEEIQKIEIKRLLGSDDRAVSGFRSTKRNSAESQSEDPDQVLAELERDIGAAGSTIGGAAIGAAGSAASISEAQLFPTPTARDQFLSGIEALCATASTQDRIDLGIAFLEMDLYEIAIRQFERATLDPAHERRARNLLAVAYLAAGKPFDAMIEVENLVADQSIPPEEKVDLGYLGGRAQEALGNFEAAAHWYRAVLQIENHYRDSQQRLLQCSKRCVSTRS